MQYVQLAAAVLPRVGVASFHLWDAMAAGAGCRIQLVINL